MNTEAKNIHSFSGFAKGKRTPTRRRSVRFSDFLKKTPLAPIIPTLDAAPSYSWPMDGNDAVGDCVVAAWDHARQTITGLLTARQLNFTQEEIWAFYKTQNPDFDPNGTAETNGPGSSADNGMDVQTFLEYLVENKYILGFAYIDPLNEQEMKAATYLGLSVITGVVLDQAQMQQFSSGTWDYTAGSPVDGGHCIPLVGFSGNPDQQTCVTWGKTIQCTQAFIKQQADEAWFILMQEHVDHPDFRDNFDLESFLQAVNEITDGNMNVPENENFVFTKMLTPGITNSDVMQLQKRLSIEPSQDGAMCYIYQEDGALYFSDYFGPNTQAAVEKYQIAHDIVKSGSPSTTGFGQVGPKTIASLNGNAGNTQIPIVDAIMMVESGGDDNATGDNGEAFGCLQIHQGVVDDVNIVLKTSYKASDLLGDRQLSLLVFNTYFSKCYPQFTTNEEIAKCWNGGPGFQEIEALANPTKEQQEYIANIATYWTKVQKALNGPMPSGV